MEESPSNPSFSAHRPQLLNNSEKSLKRSIGPNLQIRNMDRLSGLPDEILARVLSYLDMKFVVQTSVLSRPWREVWKLVPELDFSVALRCNGTETKEDRCIRFVDKVLSGHKGPINRFHLSPDFCSDRKKVKGWIRDAIKGGATELSFTSNIPGNSESKPLPKSISKSKIEALTIKTNLTLPEHVFTFPRLRYLSLSGVHLPEGSEGVLTFNSSNLRRLSFRICHFSETMKVLKVACENLEQFVLETTFSDAFELKLHAPCLTSVEFSHTISSFVRYSLEPLPKLIKAKIASSSGPFYSADLIHILEAVKHVTELDIVGGGEIPVDENGEVLVDEGAWLSICEDHFYRLKTLRLLKIDSGMQIRAVYQILLCSPRLEHVTVEIVEVPRWEQQGEVWAKKLVSHKSLEGLRYVKVLNLNGSENEFSLLVFLLGNGVLLERMMLTFPKAMSLSKQQELENFTAGLIRAPKASCHLRISSRPLRCLTLEF